MSNYVYSLLAFMFLFSCQNANENKKNIDSFFLFSDNVLVKHSFFIKLKTRNQEGQNIYYHELRANTSFASDSPLVSIAGLIYQKGKVVYLKRENDTCYREYLNFNLRKKEIRSIPYLFGKQQKVNSSTKETNFLECPFWLKLDDVFFHPILSDSIYKFRLSHAGRTDSGETAVPNDIVLLIGKKVGVQSIYSVYSIPILAPDTSENILFCAGNPFLGNRFSCVIKRKSD